ncbi:MAG: hypothetical protein R3E77_12765 [Steroidobacteraceae bacterium]
MRRRTRRGSRSLPASSHRATRSPSPRRTHADDDYCGFLSAPEQRASAFAECGGSAQYLDGPGDRIAACF